MEDFKMITLCKYCKNRMIGEFETLGSSRYRFFYSCPNCKAVYEGIREDKNGNIIDKNTRLTGCLNELIDKYNNSKRQIAVIHTKYFIDVVKELIDKLYVAMEKEENTEHPVD